MGLSRMERSIQISRWSSIPTCIPMALVTAEQDLFQSRTELFESFVFEGTVTVNVWWEKLQSNVNFVLHGNRERYLVDDRHLLLNRNDWMKISTVSFILKADDVGCTLVIPLFPFSSLSSPSFYSPPPSEERTKRDGKNRHPFRCMLSKERTRKKQVRNVISGSWFSERWRWHLLEDETTKNTEGRGRKRDFHLHCWR